MIKLLIDVSVLRYADCVGGLAKHYFGVDARFKRYGTDASTPVLLIVEKVV